jgi:aminomethyltransferase
LDWAIDYDKGDFQGKAALLKDKETAPVRLTSVVLESGGDAASGTPISVGGATVGLVTQAVVSPYLGGKTLGLAKLRKDLIEPGTRISAKVGGKDVRGEVVRHHVYDPERMRVRS